MSAPAAISIVVLVAAITYAMRASVIVALANRSLPAPLVVALRNVGPAVLAALTINLAVGGEDGDVGLTIAEAAALAAAGGVAWRTRNVPLTLVAGMVVLWISSAIA